MNAASWFYSQPGIHAPRPEPTGTPRIGQTTVAEYWDGKRWQERRLTWNGHKYVEVLP